MLYPVLFGFFIVFSGISIGWIYLSGIGFFTREVAREGTKVYTIVRLDQNFGGCRRGYWF